MERPLGGTPLGGTPSPNRFQEHDVASGQEEVERRGGALSERSLPEDSATDLDEKDSTMEEAVPSNVKNQQIEFLAAKISFLKNLYPDETNLISLLESYLNKYNEEVFDLRTFDEWRTNLITEQQNTVALVQQRDRTRKDVNIESNKLTLLIRDQEILSALFSDPVELERARTSYQLRFINLQAEEAFEKAKIYFKQYKECKTALLENYTAASERSQSRNAYYNAKSGNRTTEHTPETKDYLNFLYNKGLEKKRIFQACQAKLTLTYGSLEMANQFEKEFLSASQALTQSGFYFDKMSITLARPCPEKVNF
ncbi:MAG: hypothetical protein FJ390_05040 [Verrucomicrobia bacterium]|nr:hypothetical protein [Verrucomicrobiota bacterium]